MKESMWGYYLVLLGIIVSTVMILITNMTTTNQQDYYLLKEVTNAAMIDAIDFGYYRKYGEMKINTEKFVENFIRRFSEGISKTNTYKIEFYNIYENPPSVSIRVKSKTGDFNIAGDSTNIDVTNSIDAILEANNTLTVDHVFYSIPRSSCDDTNYISKESSNPDNEYCQLNNKVLLNLDIGSLIYNEIKDKTGKTLIDTSKIKILSIDYLGVMKDSTDINGYNSQYGLTYQREHSINDVPEAYLKEEYLAKNVKDVRITVKEKEGKYYLGYGLKFNCEGEGVETYSLYRRGTSYSDMDYISYPQSGYQPAPFNGQCLVGIKYKINFYYNDK